ncbi:hypothetical protein FOA52_011642 [Chlamydomonas sp. UWO 241]|nr:hypothetical protein FOA52_011642 [Chlamydomonas sp. UWO 241]
MVKATAKYQAHARSEVSAPDRGFVKTEAATTGKDAPYAVDVHALRPAKGVRTGKARRSKSRPVQLWFLQAFPAQQCKSSSDEEEDDEQMALEALFDLANAAERMDEDGDEDLYGDEGRASSGEGAGPSNRQRSGGGGARRGGARARGGGAGGARSRGFCDSDDGAGGEHNDDTDAGGGDNQQEGE